MKIRTRYQATCPVCKAMLPQGSTAVYDHRRGITHCLKCWHEEMKRLTGPVDPAKLNKD